MEYVLSLNINIFTLADSKNWPFQNLSISSSIFVFSSNANAYATDTTNFTVSKQSIYYKDSTKYFLK